jgi:hypothetical protein
MVLYSITSTDVPEGHSGNARYGFHQIYTSYLATQLLHAAASKVIINVTELIKETRVEQLR